MQKQKTKSYVEARQKLILIDKFLNPSEDCKRIVGLAGPQPLQCIERWEKKGFKHITTYEMNLDVFIKQQELITRKFPHVNMVLGNILTSPEIGGIYRDYDLCGTIANVEGPLFMGNEFMITWSLRSGKGHKGEGREFTENRFFELIGEKIEDWDYTDFTFNNDLMSIGAIRKAKAPKCQKEIHTDKGTYLTTSYNDSGNPMLNIVKTL